MLRHKLWFLVIAITSVAVYAQQKAPVTKAVAKPVLKETPHLTFVAEYIRELTAYEQIRDKGEQENAEAQKAGDTTAQLTSAIHTGTLFQLELRSEIAQMKGMHLNDPFDTVIPNITEFYAQRIKLWQRMIDLSTAFMAPQPGVDYNQLAAEMPKVRANLDYIDQTLYQMVPLLCGMLVDMKPDSQGHTSHLVITKAERKDLIDRLDIAFGSKLDQENPNYGVGAASLLKTFLLKDFKTADEPWE